jgi:thiol-disulfide isomerase/thioredoxin|tara:strand:- start:166 stop:897 length:732 start_codon:yes stop_codon:yes gene_type:complete
LNTFLKNRSISKYKEVARHGQILFEGGQFRQIYKTIIVIFRLDMKNYMSSLFMVLLFSILVGQEDVDHSVKKIKVGDVAPNWSIKSESGKFEFLKNWTVKKNRQLRNPSIQTDRHVVLFTFFATWCPPCVKQLEPLEIVYQKYKNKKIKFFIIDGTEHHRITWDEAWVKDAPKTRQYFNDNKINIPFLEDTDVTGKKYGIKGIPTIVVVDKFGIIQLIRVGYTKDEEDLVGDLSETIDRLLLD